MSNIERGISAEYSTQLHTGQRELIPDINTIQEIFSSPKKKTKSNPRTSFGFVMAYLRDKHKFSNHDLLRSNLISSSDLVDVLLFSQQEAYKDSKSKEFTLGKIISGVATLVAEDIEPEDKNREVIIEAVAERFTSLIMPSLTDVK